MMVCLAEVSAGGGLQSKRETAYCGPHLLQGFAAQQTCVSVIDVARRSSNRLATYFLHRYPSPDRSAYSPGRPITVFRRLAHKYGVVIGYQADLAIDLGADRVNSGATLTTTIGRRLCKRHQSSLRQSQHLVWQGASTLIWNAVWRAQALVLWAHKSLEQIQQQPHWPVPQQACSVTTRAFVAPHVNSTASFGALNQFNRRRGSTPAAVLCFGDER
jgi:hypothetical protein